MEFKQKQAKARKARRAKQKKERGLKRVRVRGRKRWIKPTSSKQEEGSA